MNQIFLRDQEVAILFGTSRAWPWRKLKADPTFPKPVRLSDSCVRWRVSDIRDWASTLMPHVEQSECVGSDPSYSPVNCKHGASTQRNSQYRRLAHQD